MMNKDEVIAVLRDHQPKLEALGIRHASLFGSVARGGANALSDIDIAIEFAPGLPTDVFSYVGAKQVVESLFDQPVDVVDRAALRPAVRRGAEADMIDAF